MHVELGKYGNPRPFTVQGNPRPLSTLIVYGTGQSPTAWRGCVSKSGQGAYTPQKRLETLERPVPTCELVVRKVHKIPEQRGAVLERLAPSTETVIGKVELTQHHATDKRLEAT